jgi:hypothetical protein
MENGHAGSPPAHPAGDQEWAELLARTVAHLAAQLTVTQLRLRALASDVAAREQASEAVVHDRLSQLARDEGGAYLRANLGDALADIIDVDELQQSLVAYLSHDESTG